MVTEASRNLNQRPGMSIRVMGERDAGGAVVGRVVEPEVCDPYSDASLDTLIDLASSSADWTERDARYLIDKVDQLLQARTWPKRLEGKPKTWERFCADVLGYEAQYIENVGEDIAILERQGIQDPTPEEAHTAYVQELAKTEREAMTRKQAGQQGGRGHKKAVVQNNSFRGGSTNAPYLTRRIKRDRPDIAERMIAGEFTSVRAAAIGAGIIKQPTGLEQLRRAWNRATDEEKRAFLQEQRSYWAGNDC